MVGLHCYTHTLSNMSVGEMHMHMERDGVVVALVLPLVLCSQVKAPRVLASCSRIPGLDVNDERGAVRHLLARQRDLNPVRHLGVTGKVKKPPPPASDHHSEPSQAASADTATVQACCLKLNPASTLMKLGSLSRTSHLFQDPPDTILIGKRMVQHMASYTCVCIMRSRAPHGQDGCAPFGLLCSSDLRIDLHQLLQ